MVAARPAGPPPGWIAAACDVGQGDAFLVRTGQASAILIDTGPDPPALRACLARMGVDRIDVLLLTHYDTDHVAAAPMVLGAYRPHLLLVGPLAQPVDNAAAVRDAAERAAVPLHQARAGMRLTVGQASMEVLWPRRVIAAGSITNNAALATAVRVDGLDLLFTGDIEPLGQAAIMASAPAAAFDVTTIPHHGSANQDPRFLQWTGADLAWVSAGRGNRHGHPRPEALDLARSAGMGVGRTDTFGTLVLLRRDGRPVIQSLGPVR